MEEEKINLAECKIKMVLSENGKQKAIFSLHYRNLEVHYFRIMESKFENENGDCLFIQPPVIMSKGKYNPVFWLRDDWDKLQKIIWRIYKEMQSPPVTEAEKDPEEEVSIEDIPF